MARLLPTQAGRFRSPSAKGRRSSGTTGAGGQSCSSPSLGGERGIRVGESVDAACYVFVNRSLFATGAGAGVLSFITGWQRSVLASAALEGSTPPPCCPN